MSAAAGASTRPLVSVIVPAYNEAAVVVDTLTRLSDHLASLEDLYQWEIVVVNDGSTDETGALAEEFARSHPNVRILHHRVNFLLGQALRYAFNSTQGDYVAVMDCDLSYEPEHLGRMLYAIQDSKARIVIASPYAKGGRTTNIPFTRHLLSRAANGMLSRAAGGGITTVTGMVRVYDGRFLRSLDLRAMDTEINTEIIYKAQILHARIIEIPAHLDWSFAQTGGKRRIATNFRVSRSTLSSLFSTFLFRPFLFFMLPGLLLGVLSAYSFFWCVWHVFQVWGAPSPVGNSGITGAIEGAYQRAPHLFLFTGITAVLSIQLISLGVIAAQGKRYFEELFHLGTNIYRRVRPAEAPFGADAEEGGEPEPDRAPADATRGVGDRRSGPPPAAAPGRPADGGVRTPERSGN
jgi:glycosyltransferase involved in cell wall biosynthesis